MVSHIAHFRLLQKLGSGKLGAVYKAYDESLDREVALRLFNSEWAEIPGMIPTFLEGAQAASIINHPKVVQVFY